MSSGALRSWGALALQLAALLALSLSLLGFAWLDPRSLPNMLLLVDRSSSMPQALADKAAEDVVRSAVAAGWPTPQRVEFAARSERHSTADAAEGSPVDPSATNIEAALLASLELHARAPVDRVVVISDGLENAGDASRALRAARAARLPVHWIAVGRPPPPTQLAEVQAPQRLLSGQRLQVSVQLAGRLEPPQRVTISMRSVDGTVQTASSVADASGRATTEFDTDRAGVAAVDVVLVDPDTGQTLDNWPDAAVVDVAPRGAVLYAQGSSGFLARSLLQGGWSLKLVPAARLDAQSATLDSYRAVVLDDVSISDASPRFWSALADAVQRRGVGLLVLGGERSFALGGYRDSILETVLPVVSEAPALGQPAAVVFAVDKSGSMGQGSAGVDRFRLAQRAVLETARRLDERDTLGLVVFDVAPRVLISLGPAAAGITALGRDWPASPGGGTKLAPALDAAIGELERSPGGRRILVLVTDGFVDDGPLADVRNRLERARVETIALAVGPDANAGALEQVLGSRTSLVLRVNETADLPQVMRAGLERRRARIERGAIGVVQQDALPFPPGTWKDWPDVAAYGVARARPDASVAVRSQRGDPLIALAQSGRGRVVAVTSGLGSWTPQWLTWREWPRLAGGLADWSVGTGQAEAYALSLSDLGGGLQVDAEGRATADRPEIEDLRLIIDTPKERGQRISMEHIAPGRWRATLPDAGPGLYGAELADLPGAPRQLHLRRVRGESTSWGVNPALEAWKRDGLIAPWEPTVPGQRRGGAVAGRPLDRTLVALGLALFLLGVAIDRTALKRSGVIEVLRRWRSLASARLR